MQGTTLRQLSQKVSVNMGILLGKGSTGNVYKGVSFEPQPHPIAIKVIPLEQINNEVTSYLLECQLEALKATSDTPNSSIVRLEQIIVSDGHCYIAMELLEGGTLKEYITECRKVEPAKALLILQKLLEGYRVLKEHGIIHRDLKPQNILFEQVPGLAPEDLMPKIIDFGYCTVEKVGKKPKMFYNVGSPRYMSPEAYTSNKYSQKSDIWAIGIILYEMLTGTNFDKGKNIMQTFKLIREKGIPIPSSLSPKCRKILQHMLMLDPNRRSSCQEVLDQLSKAENQVAEPISPPKEAMEIVTNRNIKNLRNTIISQKIMISPNNRSPNPRLSWLSTETPLKNSAFLTKSVGFVVSPISRDNKVMLINSANNTNFKADFNNMLNRSLNEANKQGPLTDRNTPKNPKNGFRINSEQKNQNGDQAGFNRSLNESASEQNLKKYEQQNHSVRMVGRQNLMPPGRNTQIMPQEQINQRKERNSNVFPFRFNEPPQNERLLTTPAANSTNSPVQSVMPQLVEMKNVPHNQRVHFLHPGQPKLPQSQMPVQVQQQQQHQQQQQVQQVQQVQQGQRAVHHQIHIGPSMSSQQQNQQHFMHQQMPLHHQMVQQPHPQQFGSPLQAHQPQIHQVQQLPAQGHQQQPHQAQIKIAQSQQVHHLPVPQNQMQSAPNFQNKLAKDPPFLNRNIRVMPMTPHGEVPIPRHHGPNQPHIFHPEMQPRQRILEQVPI